MVVTAGEVERSFMQGDVAGAKRSLRHLIPQGSIPRFLRAVEVVKGSKKKVYHFVEWTNSQLIPLFPAHAIHKQFIVAFLKGLPYDEMASQ